MKMTRQFVKQILFSGFVALTFAVSFAASSGRAGAAIGGGDDPPIIIDPGIPGVATCPGGGSPKCAMCWAGGCNDSCKGGYYCDETKGRCRAIGVSCGKKGLF
jgi:hypothetical protein